MFQFVAGSVFLEKVSLFQRGSSYRTWIVAYRVEVRVSLSLNIAHQHKVPAQETCSATLLGMTWLETCRALPPKNVGRSLHGHGVDPLDI